MTGQLALPFVIVLLVFLVALENLMLFFMVAAMQEADVRSWAHAITAAIFVMAVYVLWTFQWAH